MRVSEETGRERIRYILVLVISLLGWFSFGGMLTLVLGRLSFFTATKAGVFILTFVPHLVLLLFLTLLMRYVFGESLISLVGKKRIREFPTAALITFLVYGLTEIFSLESIVYNSTDGWGEKILFLLLSVFLLLPQTLAEEVVFRILPERILSPEERNLDREKRIFLSLFCGLFFVLPHLLNTEVTSSSAPLIPLFTYFLWGFLSSLLGTYLHSYTPVWAMHWANNFFSVVIVSGEKTTLTGAPLFYDVSAEYSPLLMITTLLVFLVVFLVFSFVGKREDKESFSG